MDPFSIASMGLGLGQLLFGASQRSQAKNLKPNNYIPPAIKENEREARRQAAATRYPGQDQDEEMVRKNAANATGSVNRNAKSASDVLNFAGRSEERTKNAFLNIGKRFSQWRDMNVNRLMQARRQVGQVQQANSNQYFAAQSALRGAGNQNIFGGFGNILGGFAIGADAGMFGKGKGGTGTGGKGSAAPNWTTPAAVGTTPSDWIKDKLV